MGGCPSGKSQNPGSRGSYEAPRPWHRNDDFVYAANEATAGSAAYIASWNGIAAAGQYTNSPYPIELGGIGGREEHDSNELRNAGIVVLDLIIPC